MYAKIEPVSYRTGQAMCLVIRNTSVQLGARAVVEWSLMSERGTGSRDYESGGVQMSGAEYAAWSDDDSYVYTWLAGKLNLVIESLEEGNYWDNLPVAPTPPVNV